MAFSFITESRLNNVVFSETSLSFRYVYKKTSTDVVRKIRSYHTGNSVKKHSRVSVVVAFEKVVCVQAIQLVYMSSFCLYSVLVFFIECRNRLVLCVSHLLFSLVTRDAILRADTSHPLAYAQNTVAFQVSYRSSPPALCSFSLKLPSLRLCRPEIRPESPLSKTLGFS